MESTTTRDWLNILTKWRAVLAGWHLGTRPKGDPECDAMRDLREAVLLLRAEVSALESLLLDKTYIDKQDFDNQMQTEARLLNEALEKRFPGFKACEYGINMKFPEAATTMERLRFKP